MSTLQKHQDTAGAVTRRVLFSVGANFPRKGGLKPGAEGRFLARNEIVPRQEGDSRDDTEGQLPL